MLTGCGVFGVAAGDRDILAPVKPGTSVFGIRYDLIRVRGLQKGSVKG